MKFLLLLLALTTANVRSAERPNIVWLVSEDNAARFLRLYDPKGAELPHIESLAKRGLTFDHAFSNAPVCSVARSTLISGCYAPRTGTQFHRRLVKVPPPAGLDLFPTYLRGAGYYCTNHSKEDYNYTKNQGVWDESSRRASYRNRKADQPFFHVENFTVTHEGSLHFNAKTFQSQREQLTKEDTNVAPYLPDSPRARFTHEWYLGRHRELDKQIGKFLAGLEEDQLLEDTIIFYYGDHGGALPRSKGYIYESGLHVPLVVTVPEKWKHLFPGKPGERIRGFVSFVDFAPTVLALAGIGIPEPMDGRPFLGTSLTRSELDARNVTYGYADRFDEKYDPVRSIRRGNFKYIRSYQPFNPDLAFNAYRYRQMLYREWKDQFHAGDLNARQSQFFQPRAPEALYDLDSDPHELVNLAADPSFRSTLLTMRADLRKWVKGLPDLSFYPEPALIESAWKNPVSYGLEHQSDIAELVDTADLSLLPYEEAAPKLRMALGSENPWKRYWAWVACSSFGKQAAEFTETARTAAGSDDNNLVRMRAAEFLAVGGEEQAVPLLTGILKDSSTGPEALLILNTMSALHDGPHACQFPKAKAAVGKRFKNQPAGSLIADRLTYLATSP